MAKGRKPTAPSFGGCRPSSATASRVKRKNKSRDTKAELLLRRELWARGARYRLHARDLPGKPDIIFRKKRVVVFCDGDFWHGRDWRGRRAKLRKGSNAPYWVSKIEYNLWRDEHQTRSLEAQGWAVVRLWESDIQRAPEQAATHVLRKLHERSSYSSY